jgi:arylsulfatase A-like enzyme
MTATRREFLQMSVISLASLGLPINAVGQKRNGQPNFVIIFLDDSGWADFRPFSRPAYATPNVERLARQGCAFHNFYVPQAICSASRASLLTGCYPGRTQVFGAHPPRARGLDPKFATIGEVLKKRGYRTAVFGKWHVGDQPETRPPARGFDESCGLMYSNDMWEYHPENPKYWGQHPLQYWENGTVAIERVTGEHQPMLTTWYAEHAVDFIRRNREHPFLLYVPHSMPHVPLFVSEKFKGKSGAGPYGDVMMEIDWSVGEIMRALKDAGVEDRTLLILTSDNGPWLSYGNHAGKTPFREGKGTGFDGGTRSACVMRYPGKIKPGTTSRKVLCTIDLMPTIAHLAGAALPENPIDGGNVWGLIAGTPGSRNPNEYYAFSTNANFEGVISSDGKWKLHLPHSYNSLAFAGKDGMPGKYESKTVEMSLFDMEKDPCETTNVLQRYPEVAARLKVFVEQHRKQFYGG